MPKPTTLAEWQEAYDKLEEKLGRQGEELGTLRKGNEQMTSSLQQYDAWAKQAAPIVDWYGKNEGEVKRRWELGERPAQQGAQAGAQPGAQAQAAAAQIAVQQPGFQWLNEAEQHQLVNQIATHLSSTVLQPWTQSFTKQVQDFANQQLGIVQNQMRSNNDVLWRTLQFVLPPEKLKEAQAWHAEALKYADPSKLDPMTMAQDALSRQGEIATLKAQVADFEKKSADSMKAAAPSILGGAPPEAAGAAPSRATSKDDRMNRVMEAVKTEHGPEGVHALFGAQTSLA